jgi:hypothetical protein
MIDVTPNPKKLKKSDYDTFAEYQKAYKEAKLKLKLLEKKKKHRKYAKVYYIKNNKAKKRVRRIKERQEAQKLSEQEKRESMRVARMIHDYEFDFLKYRYIVDYYFKKTYFPTLTKREYEFLFFMYSEPPFTRGFFVEITKGFNYNGMRLEQMIDKGIFYKSLDKKNMIDKRRKIEEYDMTISTRNVISRYYKTLLMYYEIPKNSDILKPTKANTVDYHFAKHFKRFNERREEWHKDTAFEYKEPERFDLNQRVFSEIMEDTIEALGLYKK